MYDGEGGEAEKTEWWYGDSEEIDATVMVRSEQNGNLRV